MAEETYTVQVLLGLAAELHAAGVGVYKPEGGYAADDVAIAFGEVLTKPDRGIAITAYGDDPGTLAANLLSVQFRTRGTTNPLTGQATVDRIRDHFHRRTNLQLGDFRFNLMRQTSAGPLGRDANGRWQFSQNFLLSGMRGTRV